MPENGRGLATAHLNSLGSSIAVSRPSVRQLPLPPAQRGLILPPRDTEANRFSARAARYVRVGANVGGVAAKIAATRMLGLDSNNLRDAADLAAALGGLKGPIMKVAQLMATIPDLLPSDYAAELTKLQSDAPPMGWAFVKRRMTAELGADWREKFESFEHKQ